MKEEPHEEDGEDDKDDNWSFEKDLLANDELTKETAPASGSGLDEPPVVDKDLDESIQKLWEEVKKEEPEPGVEPMENKGPMYNPDDYLVTKHGYMNYTVLLCACVKKKRWTLLQRCVDKLADRQAIRQKVLVLMSHIQKWGDTGPRRLGFDFD